MNPVTLTIDHLLGKPSPVVAEVLRLGPLAKQLNQESTRDGGKANNLPPINQ